MVTPNEVYEHEGWEDLLSKEELREFKDILKDSRDNFLYHGSCPYMDPVEGKVLEALIAFTEYMQNSCNSWKEEDLKGGDV